MRAKRFAAYIRRIIANFFLLPIYCRYYSNAAIT